VVEGRGGQHPCSGVACLKRLLLHERQQPVGEGVGSICRGGGLTFTKRGCEVFLPLHTRREQGGESPPQIVRNAWAGGAETVAASGSCNLQGHTQSTSSAVLQGCCSASAKYEYYK
jgi:hypothetical protein